MPGAPVEPESGRTDPPVPSGAAARLGSPQRFPVTFSMRTILGFQQGDYPQKLIGQSIALILGISQSCKGEALTGGPPASKSIPSRRAARPSASSRTISTRATARPRRTCSRSGLILCRSHADCRGSMKFRKYVSAACGDDSTARALSKPAARRPRLRPPAPAKRFGRILRLVTTLPCWHMARGTRRRSAQHDGSPRGARGRG